MTRIIPCYLWQTLFLQALTGIRPSVWRTRYIGTRKIGGARGACCLRVFIKLRRFYARHLGWGVAAAAAMALLTAVGLIRPKLMEYLIDQVIRQGRYRALPVLALAVLAVAVVRGVFNFGRQYLGQVFGQHATFNLRNELYHKLQYLHFEFYDEARTGDLMSRLTADVEAFRQFLSFGFVHLLDILFMIGFSLAVMLATSVKLTLITLAAMPLLLVVVLRFEQVVHPAFTAIREALSALTAAVQENITGQRTVQSFAREQHEVGKFDGWNRAYVEANLRAAALWARFFPLIELLSHLATTLLLWYGGRMVIRQEITLGQLVAFFSLIWYWIWPLREVGYQINNLIQAVAAGERLVELLETPAAICSPATARPLPECAGHVRFEHVTFAYDGEHPVLEDIALDAPPGTVIGLIGATGSGKSSLVGLIPRFYDVTRGRVTVDGHDVRHLRLEDLRRHVGVVFNETFLWSATIRENIAYGRRDATMAEIERAARLAQAYDFIMATPRQWDTVVGERGLGLSGGQRQRLAIARAILTDPRILILDDATASVDMETEHEIQKALREVMKGRTTFIIAHRISSVKHADEILVLDRGRVVERGTHAELLARGGYYREIYEIQFRDHGAAAGRYAGAAGLHGRGARCPGGEAEVCHG